jgi:hypothetical protein
MAPRLTGPQQSGPRAQLVNVGVALPTRKLEVYSHTPTRYRSKRPARPDEKTNAGSHATVLEADGQSILQGLAREGT